MKRLKTQELTDTQDCLIEQYCIKTSSSSKVKIGLLLFMFVLLSCSFYGLNKLKISDIESADKISLVSAPIAATASNKNVISIPTGIVKANPFVPYRNIGKETIQPALINDVPKFDLIAPPESLDENSPAAKIMDTVVSGILYDKFSPSAILNIDGNDYLVKKGDVVNNYKVVAIAKDSVTVMLGKNTYKAGIGEILTEGDIKHNDVSNLSKKFGGEKR